MKLNDIERAYPEWRPWLAVMDALREAMQEASWDDGVRVSLAPRDAGAPLLAPIQKTVPSTSHSHVPSSSASEAPIQNARC